MIVETATYEYWDKTIDSQVVTLRRAGADAFLIVAIQELAEQAINKAFYQDPLIATHGCRTGSTLADNVHRSVRLGAPVLISESWYSILVGRRFDTLQVFRSPSPRR